jgi:phosphate:Na+ symporter
VSALNPEIDIWRLAAGLGLFLFGMHQLEQSLRLLAGRSFKKFLREHTAHPLKGVIAGTLSTAALQSSSVVSLIVLAFVGTGVVSLASAIAIVFGSNLGTTATGWIVATIGFKLDIESLALPLIAIGGFGVVWSRVGTRRAGFSHLATGLGLMLMGLEFMKNGAISATALFDPAALSAYPPIVFLLVGFMITALIQSSSATIMITLSALYAGVIPLHSAAAVAIGADLGTTVTALLGALAGSPDKKRVAIAIVIFNVVTDAIAFVFMRPILHFIAVVPGLADPLFALVAFHSIFNLIGILIFLPLVGILSRQLGKHFIAGGQSVLRHIRQSDLAVPEAAVENINRETLRLIDQSAALNQLGFDLPVADSFYPGDEDRSGVPVFGEDADFETGYSGIKQLEGEILSFALKLQAQRLEHDESERLSQVIPALRNAVHSAKSLKDTHHDLKSFRESVDDRFNAWFGRFRDAVSSFYAESGALRNAETPSHRFEVLVALKNHNETLHASAHADIYQEVTLGHLEEVQISTLLNVNREIYSSNQSFLAALADILLDLKGATDYESIPVHTGA